MQIDTKEIENESRGGEKHMTTIVNSPAPAQTTDSGGIILLIGLAVLIGFVLVLLYFGIPVIQRMGSEGVQLNVPAPQVVIPDKVDLNITQTD